jgi:hypothetical protein
MRATQRTSGGNISGNEQRDAARLKVLQRRRAVCLRPVSVDGGDIEALALEALLQLGRLLLVQHEDQNAVLAGLVVLRQQLLQLAVLLVLLHALHDLRHAVVRAQLVAADRHLDHVAAEVLVGQVADLLGPGGAKHHRLAQGQRVLGQHALYAVDRAADRRRAQRADLPDGGLKTLVQPEYTSNSQVSKRQNVVST